MQHEAEQVSLPEYENPPVVETILGVQFDRLPSFRNAHLGAFWKTLGDDEWSLVTDAPPLQPQFEQFDRSAKWGKAGLQFTVTQDPSSRLQIKNKEGDRMIQIQNGRLHFNWLGQSGATYPRYTKVREGFIWTFQRFLEFISDEDIGSFRPNQWEVTYLNHIPKGSVWQTPDDWGFFRPLNGMPSVPGLAEAEGFNGEWHFVIPDQRGRLHVQWQHVLRSTQEENQEEIIRLTLTTRGAVAPKQNMLHALTEGLDLGRKTIVCSFADLMSDAANQFWGLKNAND